jgi:hypothetical protein
LLLLPDNGNDTQIAAGECKKTDVTQFCHLYSDIKIVKQRSNKNNHISAFAIKVLLLNGFIQEEDTESVFDDASLDMVWKISRSTHKRR